MFSNIIFMEKSFQNGLCVGGGGGGAETEIPSFSIRKCDMFL